MSKEIFTDIYKAKAWGGISVSGPGSDISQTKRLIEMLPSIFEKYTITTMLDAPCGDFHWMKRVDKSKIIYIGGDIVSDIISSNRRYETDKITFMEFNLITQRIPSVDLLFTRDCLVHFSYQDIFKFLRNLLKSNVTYFLSTSFIDRNVNQDIRTGEWRPLNLLQSPFNFPTPIDIFNEHCTENNNQFSDKCMCLWKVEDIRKCLHKQYPNLFKDSI